MTASAFIAKKVVSTLPAILTPNTLYFVRVMNGFDMYLTDITGVAYKQNEELPAINIDASRPIAYVGKMNEIIKIDYSTAWVIVRSIHPTSSLSTDWANRSTLAYTPI